MQEKIIPEHCLHNYNIFIPLFCSVSGPSIHSLNLEYHPTECKHKSNPSRFNEQPQMPVGHKGTNNVSRFIVWYSLLWLMGLGPSLIQLFLIQVLPVKFQDITVLFLFYYNISDTSWVPYFFMCINVLAVFLVLSKEMLASKFKLQELLMAW